GKVILSHAGSNSIYNHEKLCSTFSKTNLDLTELNYIYVSAGAHTVPIRNLFITFEKQPEPLDSIDNNVQHDLSDLPCDNSVDNNSSISSKLETSLCHDDSPGKSMDAYLHFIG
ncbi:unnamed protein product, partial [Rotaria sp. Silwood1]